MDSINSYSTNPDTLKYYSEVLDELVTKFDTTKSEPISSAVETGNTYSFDATSAVKQWITGALPNYGFIIYTDLKYRKIIFASTEHPDSTLWPKLTVEYDFPSHINQQHKSVSSSSAIALRRTALGVAEIFLPFNEQCNYTVFNCAGKVISRNGVTANYDWTQVTDTPLHKGVFLIQVSTKTEKMVIRFTN